MNFNSKPLRGYMAEERISQNKLAEICGISITSVRRICEDNLFSSDVLLKICNGLQLGIGDVIRLEDCGETVPLVTKPNPYVIGELTPEEVVNEQLQFFITRECELAENLSDKGEFSEFYNEGFHDCAERISKFKPVF